MKNKSTEVRNLERKSEIVKTEVDDLDVRICSRKQQLQTIKFQMSTDKKKWKKRRDLLKVVNLFFLEYETVFFFIVTTIFLG
jgi:hypothetical protein